MRNIFEYFLNENSYKLTFATCDTSRMTWDTLVASVTFCCASWILTRWINLFCLLYIYINMIYICISHKWESEQAKKNLSHSCTLLVRQGRDARCKINRMPAGTCARICKTSARWSWRRIESDEFMVIKCICKESHCPAPQRRAQCTILVV